MSPISRLESVRACRFLLENQSRVYLCQFGAHIIGKLPHSTLQVFGQLCKSHAAVKPLNLNIFKKSLGSKCDLKRAYVIPGLAIVKVKLQRGNTMIELVGVCCIDGNPRRGLSISSSTRLESDSLGTVSSTTRSQNGRFRFKTAFLPVGAVGSTW
jgi:hypothetical protein